MKRFIIESDDDRLTGDLIVDLLENDYVVCPHCGTKLYVEE